MGLRATTPHSYPVSVKRVTMARFTTVLVLVFILALQAGTFIGCKPTTCTLTTSSSPDAGGTIEPAGGIYDKGSQVTLTAMPASGYRFDHWMGAATGTSTSVTITMNSDELVTANFIEQFSLTTSANPSTGGTITPAGGIYDKGSQVTLTAIPAPGYRFVCWSGDTPRVTTSIALTMNGTTNVTALFTPADAQLKIGDYVQFGRYQDKPILWRVIEDSSNPDAKVGDIVTGDPLLFSDKAICQKPFDAAGPHDGDSDRLVGGSNLWQTSNMRAWLNSSADAGAVEWPCGNPPTKDSVDSNDYAGEKGFLADGNFAEHERNLIKPVTQKALLYYDDRRRAEGGSTAYRYHDGIDEVVNNYDNAWYQNVTDCVFLLDPKQVNGVYSRFGSYYYHKGGDSYWLRAPDTEIYVDSSSANVLYIASSSGKVMYRQAKAGAMGVRPALTLKLQSVVLTSGDGSYASPYAIAGR